MPSTKKEKKSKSNHDSSKSKKEKVPEEKSINLDENVSNPEPKKRGRVKKEPPTKEEQLKMLKQFSDELKLIIQDLKDDEMRIAPMQLKKGSRFN